MAARRDMWEEARRLVVQEGWSYKDAATATGLSLSSISKRGADEDWQGSKDVGESFIASMLRMKRIIGLKIAEDAASGEDVTQRIFGLKELEKIYPEHRYAPKKTDDTELRKAIVVETIEQLAAYLEANDRNALAAMQGHFRAFGQREAERIDGRT